jgi:hypothetical protein
MEIGDIKKVENKLGIFTIKLIEIINKNIGNSDGALGEFKNLRVEFYKDDWMSLFDQANAKYIYFVEIPHWNNYKPLTYKFEILQDEVPKADFVRLEAE